MIPVELHGPPRRRLLLVASFCCHYVGNVRKLSVFRLLQVPACKTHLEKSIFLGSKLALVVGIWVLLGALTSGPRPKSISVTKALYTWFVTLSYPLKAL